MITQRMRQTQAGAFAIGGGDDEEARLRAIENGLPLTQGGRTAVSWPAMVAGECTLLNSQQLALRSEARTVNRPVWWDTDG